MKSTVDLTELPALPRDETGPVFAEPWQAQAFAMTLALHGAGHFTWREWAACLAEAIGAARADGDPDLGDTYYHHWLSALERMVREKGISTEAELVARKGAWDAAARNTPHGKPVQL